MESVLIIGRLGHYLAAMILFGSSATAGYLTVPLPPVSRAKVMSRLRPIHRAAAAVALVSAVVWLLAVAANMGDGWTDALDPTFLGTVLRETDFGAVWIWRLVLCVGLVLMTRLGRPAGLALAVLAGANLSSIALTGHAAMDEGARALVHRSMDGIHLLAGALWIGGLVPLMLALAAPEGGGGATRRFSWLGYAAVFAVLSSGGMNAWFLVGSLRDLMTTAYGALLSSKLFLVAAMVGVAIFNRVRIAPGFAHDPLRTARRLRIAIGIELALALIIILLVSAFGTMAPPAQTPKV